MPLDWFSLHFVIIKVFFFSCKVRLGFAHYDKLTVVDFFCVSASIPYYKYTVAFCMSGFVTLALVVFCVCDYVLREIFWECCAIHVSGVVDCLVR